MKNIFLAFFAFIGCLSSSVLASGSKEPSDTFSDAFPKEASKSHLDLFAEALYWHTTETVDWAIVRTILQNKETLAYQTFSFDWSSGFRVGIGGQLPYDQWEMGFSYTRFTAQSRGRASGIVNSAFFGAVESVTGPYQVGLAHLKLHYNMLEAELGRNLEISKTFFLRPFIGIKGGWLDQKIHTRWQKPLVLFTFEAIENLKNKFRGLGPLGGVEGKWIWKTLRVHSFSLLGDCSGAFMWGHWTIRDRFQDNFFVRVKVITPSSNFGSLVLQAFVGLGWDIEVDNKRSHLNLRLGYEIEDWLNQYQIFDDGTGGHNNDLLLQGLTFHLRYDF
jgi:hypothetical protein